MEKKEAVRQSAQNAEESADKDDFSPGTGTPFKKIELTAFKIKLRAMGAMLADNFATIVLLGGMMAAAGTVPTGGFDLTNPWHMVFKILNGFGQMAYPLFAFLAVQGYLHTRSKWFYIGRMMAGALISQIPFSLAFYGQILVTSQTNAFFTLLLGLLGIYLCDCAVIAARGSKYLGWLMMVPCVYICFFAGSYVLKCSFGGLGVLMVVFFYLFREKELWRDVIFAILVLLFGVAGPAALFCVIVFRLYNGELGYQSKGMQYAFYLVYPLHLLLFYGLSMMF